MASKSLKLAIISDLHCHPKRPEGRDDTYLLTDKLRSPSNDHPVEHLLQIIKKDQLKADLTLCPGDFTDKANIQGFISGWGFAQEIHRALKSKEIIATLGNHDVDAYAKISNYSLTTAKGIKGGFPIEKDTECDIFWSKGCVFVERKNCRILVINSSHFHHNKESAGSGKVSDDLVDYVREYLGKVSDDKIQIALSHHHPIDHSSLKLGEEDKIENADGLLELLGQYKFDLFIHGHKHDPLLRYHLIANHSHKLPILSSGSFSSSSNIMYTSKRNAFHLIKLTKGSTVTGEIQTYTFFPNLGWSLNYDANGFAPYSGFGSDKSVDQLFDEISTLMSDKIQLAWSDLKTQIPQVKNLIPAESKILYDKLAVANFKTDKTLWETPTLIFNANSK